MAPDAEACDLRVCLLGGFRAFVGPRPVADAAWRRRKARSLVKLLALVPGHRLHREQLLDALWPDLPPAAALNNLHKVLYLARRALEPELPATRPSAYLLFQDDLVLLSSPRTLWIDVDAFRDAATQAHRVRTPDAYRAALALCGGDLLPEDPYEDWVAPRREECRAQFLALLLGQARAHEERGEREQAVEALHRVLLSEPAHEEAHVGLMRLHARGGQRHLALRQYAQLREALARELDAEPDPASQELHAAILAGRLPPSLPVSPSTDAGGAGADAAPGERRGARDEAGSPREPPSNLPAQLSSFIGRQREIAEARRLLATTRLLTLTGAGGCGKSRLGIELAAAVAPQFPDGVWLAELASLHDPTLLVASVQAALDIPDQPGQAGAGALVGYLRDKRALLVLDNCEHLVDACAPLVVTLLRACPRLRVLATSREPLRIDGETIYRVPPLSLPPADRSAGDDLLRFDAVRLFVERARAVAPTFAITPPSRRPVVEVCRRLDGMPLALELAAARLGLLSIHQIAERLDDCFRLLTAGNRAGLPRHRTLRATLEWSHRLLADPERALFRRLAVFAGGFSLAAAEAIGDGVGCQGSGVGEGTSLPDTLSVLDLLG
jgi:DNA-binding SARP family transcriptional activator